MRLSNFNSCRYDMGDGETCVDVDECQDGNNGGCDPRTECINVPGSVECGPCPYWARGSGKTGWGWAKK